MAFKDAMRKAQPELLEPMMQVEVETPEEFTGNVMGDLSTRRGMVQGMDEIPGGGGKLIGAEVPLAEMFGYSTTLRSLTQGRATYTMEFKHYAAVPNTSWTRLRRRGPKRLAWRLHAHSGSSGSARSPIHSSQPQRGHQLYKIRPTNVASPKASITTCNATLGSKSLSRLNMAAP